MSPSFLIILVALTILIVAWTISCGVLVRRIHADHPQLYLQLGSPNLKSSSLKWEGKLLDFIFRREHQSLGDNQLSLMSDIALLAFAGFIALCLLAIFYLR